MPLGCYTRDGHMHRDHYRQQYKQQDSTNPQCKYSLLTLVIIAYSAIQVNLDMTDSMEPGKLVRHMQNPSYTYDEYLICIGLGPSILSVICKNLSYSGLSYPSSPVLLILQYLILMLQVANLTNIK